MNNNCRENSDLIAHILREFMELPSDRKEIFKGLCACFARCPGFQEACNAIIPPGEPAPTWEDIGTLVNAWYVEATE